MTVEVEMPEFTDEQKEQLNQLQRDRKTVMLELKKVPNSDELNKQYLLGQLQDIQAEIARIVRPQ